MSQMTTPPPAIMWVTSPGPRPQVVPHEEAKKHLHVLELRLVDQVLHVEVHNLNAICEARLVDGAPGQVHGARVDLHTHAPKLRVGACQTHEALGTPAAQVGRQGGSQ